MIKDMSAGAGCIKQIGISPSCKDAEMSRVTIHKRDTTPLKNAGRRKAQFGMMEYLILALFMLVVIVAIVFFLFGWEFGAARRAVLDQAHSDSLFMINLFTHSGFFTERDIMLDDSKLMVTKCGDMEGIFGRRLCINITAVLFVGEEGRLCTLSNYPDCNQWVICPDLCSQGNLIGYDVPVNIYRRVGGKTELGILDLRMKI